MSPEMLLQLARQVQLEASAESESRNADTDSRNAAIQKNKHILHKYKVTRFSGVEVEMKEDDVTLKTGHLDSKKEKTRNRKWGIFSSCFGTEKE